MNIWFLLWVFLTVFLIGLFGWSFHILLRQRRAWVQFGKKNNLAVNERGMFASVSITGMLRTLPFYLYSEEQAVGTNGGRRFRTIIQIELPGPMPVPGIVASADAANFARGLNLREAYVPEFDFWNKNIVVLTDNAEGLKPYMTEERCRSLNAVMTIKSIASILIFDDKNVYLRFETADPFDNAAKLQRFVDKAMDQAKILSIR